MDQDLASELFGTETMAELCARQGRIGDAVAIYRKLLAAGGLDQRRDRWSERLQVLLHAPADQPRPGPPGTSRGTPPAKTEAVSGAAVAPPLEEHRMPMVIQQPVRSGQIIYAERNDLIVLAPVNPGAQLIADGNIHIYAPLRGRAVAGAHGAVQARIFCQRLEAELVGVDSAYVVSEDIPPDRLGKPAQISLADGLCVIAPL